MSCIKKTSLFERFFIWGFVLRSASVRAEQTSTGRLAPRPTPLSGVRTLRCLALKKTSLFERFFIWGFVLRSASVRAKQTSTGRLAPRPTPLSGVRTLRCLALKKRLYSRRFFNETSGIRTPDNLIKSQVLYHLS